MNRHSLRVLEFEKIRDALETRATFPGGARRLRQLSPLVDPSGIARRLGGVSEVRRVLEDSDLPLHGLPDLEESLASVEPVGSALTGPAIAPIAKSLHIVRKIVSYLHERRDTLPILHEQSRELAALGELREEIERKLDPAGEVRDDATPALRRIRKDQEKIRGRLLEALQRIVRGLSPGESDAVVTLRNERYVVRVRRDRLASLRGVVHGQSGSGASVYFEPTSIVPANNELAELRSAEKEEIRRILAELSDAVRLELLPLTRNEELLSELDAFYAAGCLSRDLNALPALPSQDGGVVVRKGRHPVLEMANGPDGVVPLDLEFGGETPRTLVITGPNTGGKTVALKTVGLFALMNQCGLHVPAAEGTRFPVLRNVFADIGDEQSIEASLSTFSSHMAHVNEVLREADGQALVLLDELGVGTDPEEGAALGRAILSELTRAEALTVVTTHYGSLKVFAHEQEGMQNASLEFDRDSLAPTYRFLQGVPGSSEALSIARRLGFPEHLVQEARETLGGEKEAIESLLHDLQERRAELERARIELADLREETEGVRESVSKREEALKKERTELKREAMAEARRLVERTKEELTRILGAVKADGTGGKAAGRARTRLGEMGGELDRELTASAGSHRPSRPVDPEQVKEGTPVLIPSMGWKGTALGAPQSNGKVAVTVGSLRVEVPVDSLEVREPTAAEKRRTRPTAVVSSGDVAAPTEIDLRGRTVDEAVETVDRTLDGLVVAGLDRLRIIHGKGTGALRAAITDQLETDGRVKSFRLGEPGEGGSGVTIAMLK